MGKIFFATKIVIESFKKFLRQTSKYALLEVFGTKIGIAKIRLFLKEVVLSLYYKIHYPLLLLCHMTSKSLIYIDGLTGHSF
jgi:hypothetical protein